jgi:hypothetical protein
MRRLLDPLSLVITTFVLLCAIYMWAIPLRRTVRRWAATGERLSGEIDLGRVEVMP